MVKPVARLDKNPMAAKATPYMSQMENEKYTTQANTMTGMITDLKPKEIP